MSFLTLNTDNIYHEHICCAIGNDKENTQRAQTKKDWLRSRFEEGLTFRRLDIRGKVFIEYIPIEHVWKPLVGQNHLVINCLWVSGQFKGKGYAQKLLETCLNDANTRDMDGVAVVTSTSVKPFLTDKRFYMKHGFEIADSAPPFFELLLHKTNPGSQSPSFADHIKTGST
ncbi:MAG TPA: GNAT family N-acetyltransferase, partial [Rhodothermales bacterium]|nr:GNAT family N-acetyltransferase [Rhodothermales bacterium]